MNVRIPDLSSYLKTPEGMAHTAINDITVQRQNERQSARGYKFTFEYKGKQKKVEVWGTLSDPLSEIEELAGEEGYRWRQSLDEEEYKRPPTEEEKKQIGKSLNDFYLHAQKRRDSSNNRLYYPGVR